MAQGLGAADVVAIAHIHLCQAFAKGRRLAGVEKPADLEGQARRLCGFLEVPWEQGLLDYRARAKEDLIVTPSYHQVVRPLYDSSRQRWRRYAVEMEAVLPLLAPFVESLGYDV